MSRPAIPSSSLDLGRRLGPLAISTLLMLGGACGSGERLPPLEEVPRADLKNLEQAVRNQLEAAYAEVDTRRREVETEASPPGSPAARRLGQSFGDLGSKLAAYHYWAWALAALTNAERLDPAPRWTYLAAHMQRSLGHLEESAATFERFLAGSPEDVPALVWLGENHLEIGQLENARTSFAAATKIRPECVRAHFGLGRVALESDEPETAIRHLREANRLYPASSHVRYALAQALRQNGETAEAKLYFEGSHLDHLNRLPLAVKDPLMDQIHGWSLGATGHEHRGLRAAARGDLRVAVSSLRQAVALDPERVSAWHNLGLALLRMGQKGKAVSELERLLERHPHHAPTWVLLGNVARNEGDEAGALDRYRKALSSDPGSTEARAALADLAS